MDIRLEKLGAGGFTLELPATDTAPDRVLGIDELHGLGGHLHTEPGVLRLEGARADSGIISRLAWTIGRVRATSESPIALTMPRLESTHATGGSDTPLRMDASASEIAAATMALVLPAMRATGDLVATETTLKVEDGETHFAAATARTDNLQLHTESLFLRGAIALAGLRVDASDAEGPQIVAARASSEKLHLESGAVVLEASDVELASGLAFKRGEVRLDAIRIGELSLTIRLAPPDPDAPPPPEPRARVALRDDIIHLGERQLFDLRDLDRFEGDSAVAVFVKAQLPVVGRYRLDRTFKVPITNGQINFVDLERQLGTIEDAFIDFAVRDGELVLKRDIPLLPTKGKTLVRWPLSEVEQHLADNRLIRLRALSRFELEKASSSDKKATISAVKVDIPTFQVTLPAAADERPDAWGVVPAEVHIRSIDKLEIGGGLFFNNDAGTRELSARLRTEGLRLQVAGWPFAGRHAFAQSVSCGALEIAVPEWDGFRPLAVTFTARDVVIERGGLRDVPEEQAAATEPAPSE